MPLLELEEITKEFPGVRALDRVSFDLEKGEIHALSGENGAGKTTLIKVLSGFYPHGSYGGEIRLRGETARFAFAFEGAVEVVADFLRGAGVVPDAELGEEIRSGCDFPGRVGPG